MFLGEPHGSLCPCRHLASPSHASLQYSCLENPMDGGAW